MKNCKFAPGRVRVKRGSVVAFYNDDVIEPTITGDIAGGTDTGRMRGA